MFATKFDNAVANVNKQTTKGSCNVRVMKSCTKSTARCRRKIPIPLDDSSAVSDEYSEENENIYSKEDLNIKSVSQMSLKKI